jgi:hypothetical protein
MLAPNADLLVKGESDGIENWIGQIVDQLNCRIGISETRAGRAVYVEPIGQIDARSRPFS